MLIVSPCKNLIVEIPVLPAFAGSEIISEIRLPLLTTIPFSKSARSLNVTIPVTSRLLLALISVTLRIFAVVIPETLRLVVLNCEKVEIPDEVIFDLSSEMVATPLRLR